MSKSVLLNFSQCALQWKFESNFAVLKLMDHFRCNMLEHALYDSFIKIHTNPFWHKLWHLFKRSLKFFNLATFRLKNTKEKMHDLKIVAIVAKRKFESEPYDSFVELEAFLNV